MKALVFIVLVDAAIAVWFLNRRSSAPGIVFNEPAVPVVQPVDQSLPAAMALPRSAPPPQALPPGSPLPVPGFQAPPSLGVAGRGTPAGAAGPRGQDGRGLLSQAAGAFISLERSPRFRSSPVLRQWDRDFLSYPDLRAINNKYWKDRDALSFVVSTLRSPNFGRLVKSHAQSQDVQRFVLALIQAPSVVASVRFLGQDKSVLSAMQRLTIPGLPPLGALMGPGGNAALPNLGDSKEMERLETAAP